MTFKLCIKKQYFYINANQSSEHFDWILFSGSCSLPSRMFQTQTDPLSREIHPPLLFIKYTIPQSSFTHVLYYIDFLVCSWWKWFHSGCIWEEKQGQAYASEQNWAHTVSHNPHWCPGFCRSTAQLCPCGPTWYQKFC